MPATNIDFYSFIAKTQLENNFIAAEIGSHIGISANHLCNYLKNINKIGKLYCIDIWWGDKDADQDYNELKDKGNHEHYIEFLRNSKENLDLIVPIKCMSSIAASLFKDEYFDFVYIDGAHEYEFIKEDLELWYPKVKTGGILAGHDFDVGHAGCWKAVPEFCEKNQIKTLTVLNRDNFLLRK